MVPFNALVTGGNRGIGLELARSLLQMNASHLFVTCRNPDKAEELSKLATAQSNVHIMALDVTDHSAYPDIAKQISETVGEDGLNLVINNAGIFPDEAELGLDPDMMRKCFEVHCLAPVFLTRALMPLLEKGANARSHLPTGIRRGAVVMMSSRVASFADNSSGKMYAVRCSKAALNMATKNFSIDFQKQGSSLLAVAMNPGWVQTDMGGAGALIDAKTCVEHMMETLKKLTEEDNGAYIDYKKMPIQW